MSTPLSIILSADTGPAQRSLERVVEALQAFAAATRADGAWWHKFEHHWPEAPTRSRMHADYDRRRRARRRRR